MRVRNLTLALLTALCALGATTPARSDDDWRRFEHREWREHERRRHEWREHEWRERQWREREMLERQRYYAPPVVVVPAPGYGYSRPPPVYYTNPGYR